MITKMTDRAWLSNQYRDFPPLDATLWFVIFGRVFGVRVFSRSGLVAFFIGRTRRFYGDLGVVGQTVSTIGYDLLAFFQSLGDLQLVVLTDSRFDRLLMRMLIGSDHHNGGGAIGGRQKQRCRDYQRIRHGFGNDRQPNPRPGPQRLVRILRLPPDVQPAAR